MNCLDRVTIQMYVDKELTDEHSAEIQSHLDKCKKCQDFLEDSRTGKSEINAYLSALHDGESNISVPPFNPDMKRPRFRKRYRISMLGKVAAGIALLVGLFWIIQSRPSSQELTPDQAELLLLELMGDMEPNKAWHNGQLGIIILDENGEVLQSFISND
ncbi:MAG: zf-HC2 domain-containing protein [Bacteroidales bacterium]|nr:zf-HC2 domain-containing protein [Bacteroidales bacterium]